MRACKWAGVVFLGVFCSLLIWSCVPEFTNPLPRDRDLKCDLDILGNWVSKGEKGIDKQISIFPRKSGWVDVIYVCNINSDSLWDGMTFFVFEGYSAQSNKDKFLCLRTRKKDKNATQGLFMKDGHTYMMVYYNTSKKDTLSFALLSQEKIQSLIKSGELEGKVTKSENMDRVTVTSSTEKIWELIARKNIDDLIDRNINLGGEFKRESN